MLVKEILTPYNPDGGEFRATRNNVGILDKALTLKGFEAAKFMALQQVVTTGVEYFIAT
jgi:hypothetical protein